MARPVNSSRIRIVESPTDTRLPEYLMTTKQVCELLRCSEGCVRQLRRSGSLPALKLGDRLIRFRRSDVEALMGSS